MNVGSVRLEVEDFPAFILVDDKGNDYFAQPVQGGSLPQRQRCAACRARGPVQSDGR